MYMPFCVFFFFKQNTAYEMRFSDWSSDVCSSDLFSSLRLNTEFFIAYLGGFVILVLFCIERFNEPTNTGGSFVEALVPRAVSNGFQYIQTFVIYVAILFVV